MSLFDNLLNFHFVLGLKIVLVEPVEVGVGKFELDVGVKACVLSLLPSLLKQLNSLEGEGPLRLGKRSILTHGVQANNELLLGGLKLLVMERFPFLLFFGALFFTFFIFFFALLIFPLLNSYLLLFNFLISLHIIDNSSIISFFKQARLVLKLDCQVGSKFWHLEILYLFVSHNFIHENVLQNSLRGLVYHNWVSF